MDTQRYYDGRMAEALALVAEAFATRRRKGSAIPYLSHLLAVTALVMEHGGDEEQAIAAILHDYLEDIPGASASELEQRFGRRVAWLVTSLSDATDATNKAPWRARKEAYLAHLRDAPADVKLVSAADKLHNAESVLRDHELVGMRIFERFSAPRESTLWYYREVHAALSHGFESPLLARLARAVDAMHALG